MPQLLIDHLPVRVKMGVMEHTYRHWLVYEDGRIFFQDEIIKIIDDDTSRNVQSLRRDWQQLPTPPVLARVVGVIDHGGLPMAMLDNGKSFLWSREGGTQRWVEVFSPVPDTAAYAEWSV